MPEHDQIGLITYLIEEGGTPPYTCDLGIEAPHTFKGPGQPECPERLCELQGGHHPCLVYTVCAEDEGRPMRRHDLPAARDGLL